MAPTERLDALTAAVRAVLELHASTYPLGDYKARCATCSDRRGKPIAYPCRTVRAITTPLETP